MAVSAWIAGAALLFGVHAPDQQADLAAASEAFSMAQRAELAHENARAAEFYELADSLVPSAEALRSATKNRYAAGQIAIAANRAEALLRRYPNSDESIVLANEVLERAQGELAAVSASCNSPCVIGTETKATSPERALSHRFYLEPGSHKLVASFRPGQQDVTALEVKAGETLELAFHAPAAEPPPAIVAPPPASSEPLVDTAASNQPSGRARISPVFFAVGAVSTAALGAATIWSGLDVSQRHSDYTQEPTADEFDAGRSAQLRTNVLIGATAAVGVTTVVFAIFTDWARRSRQRLARTHR